MMQRRGRGIHHMPRGGLREAAAKVICAALVATGSSTALRLNNVNWAVAIAGRKTNKPHQVSDILDTLGRRSPRV